MLVLTCIVAVAIVAAVLLAFLPVMVDLTARQRAQTAADAAALAGVTGGESASAELASANGAVLVRWGRDGRDVTVTVELGEVSATARATDAP